MKAKKAVLIPDLTSAEGPVSYEEDDVRGYVVEKAHEGKPAFGSDHKPICSTFEYR